MVCAVSVTGQEMPWVFFDGFESGDTSGWWASARVGETGQVTCFGPSGTVIACAGTGQDGDFRPGVAWPNPRFVNNGDGTVTDMLTGLVWLRDASCADLAGTDAFGRGTWLTALSAVGSLADGACGLTDGSEAGNWRLPSRFEIESLIDLEYAYPALSNAAGTAKWTEGNAFSGVQSGGYWSSTSNASFPQYAWFMFLDYGPVLSDDKMGAYFVWPVRGGK
jgi:hypothetical protein